MSRVSFSGVTISGGAWRKVPKSEARNVILGMRLYICLNTVMMIVLIIILSITIIVIIIIIEQPKR